MIDPPDFETQSHPKSQTEGTNGPTKCTSVLQKLDIHPGHSLPAHELKLNFHVQVSLLHNIKCVQNTWREYSVCNEPVIHSNNRSMTLSVS